MSHRIFLLLFSTCFLVAAPCVAQGKGAVSGIVLDEGGLPVVGAKVYAAPIDGRLPEKLLRYVVTDSGGHFLIEGLNWGKYGVYTMKEESGYPDMGASFYSNNVYPSATLSLDSPAPDLRIRLGPKAGLLNGSVTNAANGAPLPATFKLSLSDSPSRWVGTSLPSNYRVLLPASTDVHIEVTVPGFELWTYPIPIRLDPGSEMHLDIKLHPSHDPNLHPSKFLIPEGYAGWLLLDYNVKDTQPVPVENDVKIFKFPATGALSTSSFGPERGAEDEYFYYSAVGSLHEIPTDYRNGKGMIWGQYEGTRNGTLSQFGFFVGTEEQYKKFQTRTTHPGPIPSP